MPVKNRFAELQDEIVGWRKEFHRHPELLFDTHWTAAKVAELLKGFGCDEVVEGIGQTGVVGVIRGKTDTAGKVVGLRADMDALPISEATGLDYASEIPGKMHACGHDGHMAMLLGAAKYLAETRNFDGTAVVIFQPAEEGGGGGDAMVKDGLMDRFGIQEVYGMHNIPGLPVGQFGIRPGPIMAAADKFTIHVTGKGGHAAHPNLAIDTTLVASQIVVALQSIVSRNVNPLKSAVLSVCTIATDSTAHNVIPETVNMDGTVRTFDPEVQDMVERRLSEVVEGVASAMGATAHVEYQRGYPATINSEEPTEFVADIARSVTGDLVEIAPQMGAEDFSFMLNERPGAYIFLGIGDGAMWHHPEYRFNDEAIPAGASWWAEIIEKRLPAA